MNEEIKNPEEKKCSTHCDWPNCTFKDCMEKHPEESIKSGPHKFIEEIINKS